MGKNEVRKTNTDENKIFTKWSHAILSPVIKYQVLHYALPGGKFMMEKVIMFFRDPYDKTWSNQL